MPRSTKDKQRNLVGLAELLRLAGDAVPPPFVTHDAAGARRIEHHTNEYTEITVPARFAPKTLRDHLLFAIKNEALDLRIWDEVVRF